MSETQHTAAPATRAEANKATDETPVYAEFDGQRRKVGVAGPVDKETNSRVITLDSKYAGEDVRLVDVKVGDE